MQAKPENVASAQPVSNGSCPSGSCLLLELPVVLLHLILGLLGSHDLTQLLHTSKAMAQEVMQCRAGRLVLRLERRKGVRLAAVRQVLQWAPSSTIKLMLSGLHLAGTKLALSDWSILNRLLSLQGRALPAESDHHCQHMQQLPCILEVCIQGFTLPSLVPADLAAMCPNMHTLHLHCCAAARGSNNSSLSSSKASSSRTRDRGSCVSMSSVSTLILEITDAPCSVESPAGSLRKKRSMQLTAQHIAQLQHGLPNMACLKLQHSPVTVELLSTVGQQLTELHLAKLVKLPSVGLGTHLRQLQKLVLPDVDLSPATDMEHLLSLHSLTHLEVGKLGETVCKDYSSYPCKWQYLHLHLRTAGMFACALATMPLHSLTYPLVLGHENGGCVTVLLPPSLSDSKLDELQGLAQQLMKCGVRLLAPRLAWACDIRMKSILPLDAPDYHWPARYLEPAFMVIAPAVGPHARVTMNDIYVDVSTLDAFTQVYGSRLEWLGLDKCVLTPDALRAWPALLSGFPRLKGLEFFQCFQRTALGSRKEAAVYASVLTWAMQLQPAGRSLDFVAYMHGESTQEFFTSQELVATVLEDRLAGVQVTAIEAGADVCSLRITKRYDIDELD